jgi:CHAD domain-containing protein
VDEADSLTGQSCGSFAAELLACQAKRLVTLQLDVLADRDPEPLHQMRVTCRQLRATVEQFADALVLPEQVSSQRLARVGSDLGLSRDLDVLQQGLERHWWPLLPEQEQATLRKVMKQLKRERKLAFSLLSDTLKGRRYLKLLSRLQGWLKDPQYTPMGQEPIALWAPELQQVALAGLLTLPGWWATHPFESPSTAALHRLRRRIKRARYGLANLAALDLDGIKPWIVQFKALQTSLGDLQDLQVLVATLERLLEGAPEAVMPVLSSLIFEARDQAWTTWRHASADLRTLAGRQRLLSLQVLPSQG